jgi:hypothetical protein
VSGQRSEERASSAADSDERLREEHSALSEHRSEERARSGANSDERLREEQSTLSEERAKVATTMGKGVAA